MTVRDIRRFGDPVLRQRAEPVDPTDAAAATLVHDLLDTVRLPGRAGVAACQIGVPAAAFSYNVDGEVGYILNPRLEVDGDVALVDEGCLSVPGLGFPTPRHPWARCVGIDLEGAEVVVEGEGLMAQMLQHECGHLDGKVYVQVLDRETRGKAMTAIRESDWF